MAAQMQQGFDQHLWDLSNLLHHQLEQRGQRQQRSPGWDAPPIPMYTMFLRAGSVHSAEGAAVRAHGTQATGAPCAEQARHGRACACAPSIASASAQRQRAAGSFPGPCA